MELKGNITTILLIAAIAVIGFLYIKESSHTSGYKKEVKELQKDKLRLQDSINTVRLQRKNLRVQIDSVAEKAYIADSLLQESNLKVADLIKRYKKGIEISVIHNDSIDSELKRIYSRHGLETVN